VGAIAAQRIAAALWEIIFPLLGIAFLIYTPYKNVQGAAFPLPARGRHLAADRPGDRGRITEAGRADRRLAGPGRRPGAGPGRCTQVVTAHRNLRSRTVFAQ
jgi:hypothetical protein